MSAALGDLRVMHWCRCDGLAGTMPGEAVAGVMAEQDEDPSCGSQPGAAAHAVKDSMATSRQTDAPSGSCEFSTAPSPRTSFEGAWTSSNILSCADAAAITAAAALPPASLHAPSMYYPSSPSVAPSAAFAGSTTSGRPRRPGGASSLKPLVQLTSHVDARVAGAPLTAGVACCIGRPLTASLDLGLYDEAIALAAPFLLPPIVPFTRCPPGAAERAANAADAAAGLMKKAARRTRPVPSTAYTQKAGSVAAAPSPSPPWASLSRLSLQFDLLQPLLAVCTAAGRPELWIPLVSLERCHFVAEYEGIKRPLHALGSGLGGLASAANACSSGGAAASSSGGGSGAGSASDGASSRGSSRGGRAREADVGLRMWVHATVGAYLAEQSRLLPLLSTPPPTWASDGPPSQGAKRPATKQGPATSGPGDATSSSGTVRPPRTASRPEPEQAHVASGSGMHARPVLRGGPLSVRVASEVDGIESDAMSEDSIPCTDVVISHAELDEARLSPPTSGAASGDSTPNPTDEPMGLGARLLRAFSSPGDVSRVERHAAHEAGRRDDDEEEGGLQPRLQDWRRGLSAPDVTAAIRDRRSVSTPTRRSSPRAQLSALLTGRTWNTPSSGRQIWRHTQSADRGSATRNMLERTVELAIRLVLPSATAPAAEEALSQDADAMDGPSDASANEPLLPTPRHDDVMRCASEVLAPTDLSGSLTLPKELLTELLCASPGERTATRGEAPPGAVLRSARQDVSIALNVQGALPVVRLHLWPDAIQQALQLLEHTKYAMGEMTSLWHEATMFSEGCQSAPSLPSDDYMPERRPPLAQLREHSCEPGAQPTVHAPATQDVSEGDSSRVRYVSLQLHLPLLEVHVHEEEAAVAGSADLLLVRLHSLMVCVDADLSSLHLASLKLESVAYLSELALIDCRPHVAPERASLLSLQGAATVAPPPDLNVSLALLPPGRVGGTADGAAWKLSRGSIVSADHATGTYNIATTPLLSAVLSPSDSCDVANLKMVATCSAVNAQWNPLLAVYLVQTGMGAADLFRRAYATQPVFNSSITTSTGGNSTASRASQEGASSSASPAADATSAPRLQVELEATVDEVSLSLNAEDGKPTSPPPPLLRRARQSQISHFLLRPGALVSVVHCSRRRP